MQVYYSGDASLRVLGEAERLMIDVHIALSLDPPPPPGQQDRTMHTLDSSHTPRLPDDSAVPHAPQRLIDRRTPTILRIILVMMLLQLGGPAPPARSLPPEHPGLIVGTALQGEDPPAGFVPEWSWPLHPAPKVLRLFDKPAQNWNRGHRGVDLAVGAMLPGSVVSPAAGVVSFAGTVVDRGVVSIDHGDGRISSFEPVDPLVVKGQRIAEGELAARVSEPTVGSTGGSHCSESCLHWGVRVDGEYVDPLGFVLDRRPSVLLPMDE